MIKSLTILFLFFSLQFSSQSVYSTPSGKKYHLASCRMVKNVSKLHTVENALRSGFKPCNICKPPTLQTKVIPSSNSKAKGTNSKNRCLAITKKGLRCKRNTEIGNNYCFQH